MEQEKKKKWAVFILGGLGLYLLTAGVSYAAFRYLGSEEPGLISPLPVEEGRAKINLDAPKTESCPLTGEMFTKSERSIWEKRRPLGIMIENHADSRPQSGLSRADIVYEAVAEGGITRFLAVYLCRSSVEDVLVGPVRSARTYFLDWISEYGAYPLYAHVGGANIPGKVNALGQIGDYGWLRMGSDLNQFSLGFPTFWRDYERLGRPVATEHTMYSTTDRLWEVGEKRGLTQTDEEGNRWDEEYVSWQFKEEASEEERGETGEIKFSFWSGKPEYGVRWQYDHLRNLYLRNNNGQVHKDLDNDQQVSAKVVVIQFAKETGPVDELKHLLYQTSGKGKAIIFQDGQVTTGTWQKKDRLDRTIFFDSQDQEIEFNPGPIWIEVLPAGNEVSY